MPEPGTGERPGIDTSIDEAIADHQVSLRAAAGTEIKSLGAANPADVGMRQDTIQAEAVISRSPAEQKYFDTIQELDRFSDADLQAVIEAGQSDVASPDQTGDTPKEKAMEVDVARRILATRAKDGSTPMGVVSSEPRYDNGERTALRGSTREQLEAKASAAEAAAARMTEEGKTLEEQAAVLQFAADARRMLAGMPTETRAADVPLNPDVPAPTPVVEPLNPPPAPRRPVGFVPNGMNVHDAASVMPDMIRPQVPAAVIEVTKEDTQPFKDALKKRQAQKTSVPIETVTPPPGSEYGPETAEESKARFIREAAAGLEDVPRRPSIEILHPNTEPTATSVEKANDFNPEVAPPKDVASTEIPDGFNPEVAPPKEKLFNPEEAPPADTTPAIIQPPTPEVTPSDSSTETKPEKKEGELSQRDIDLIDARKAYGNALRSQGKWFGQASPAKLQEAQEKYQQLVTAGIVEGVAAVKKTFAGKDLTNPDVQSEYIAQLAEVTITRQLDEQRLFRESMRAEGHRSLVGKFRGWYSKRIAERIALGVGLNITEHVMAAHGNVGGVAAVRTGKGALAFLGTFMTVHALGQATAENFGATRKLSDDQIEELVQPEGGASPMLDVNKVEERIAADTMLQVDKNVAEYGEKGSLIPFSKKKDSTGAKTLKVYDEALRTNHEVATRLDLQMGKGLDGAAAAALERANERQVTLHEHYINRVRQNHKINRRILMTATAAGAASGAAAFFGLSPFGHHGNGPAGASHDTHGFSGAMDQAKPEGGHAAAAIDTTTAHSPHGFSDAMNHAQAESDHTSAGLAGSHEHVTGAGQHVTPDSKSWADLRHEDDIAMHQKSWAEMRMEDDPGYQAAMKAAQEAGKHVYTAKPGDGVWRVAGRYVADHYPNLNKDQQAWMIATMQKKIGTHALKLGQSIDFNSFKIDYQDLAHKASLLSQAKLASVHEGLLHQAAAMHGHAVEAGHAATTTTPVEVVAPRPTLSTEGPALDVRPSPRRLSDLKVMFQDKTGNLVDMNQHLPDATHTVAADTAQVAPHVDTIPPHTPMLEGSQHVNWTPDIRHQLDSYISHREYWQKFEADPKAFARANEAFNHLTVGEASRPLALEQVLSLGHGKDPAFEHDMAKAIRSLIKKVGGVNPKEPLWKFLEYLRQDLPK